MVSYYDSLQHRAIHGEGPMVIELHWLQNYTEDSQVFANRTLKLLLCCLVLAGCSEPAATPESGADADKIQPRQSHLDMVQILEEIRTTPIQEHLYFQGRTLEKEESDIARLPEDRPDLRFKLMYHVGRRHLWQGTTEKAVEWFTAALALAEEESWADSEADRDNATFQLGLAYLRLGENENCVNCNNGASCLLPIRNAGVHEKQSGSRNAVIHFADYLERQPESYEAQWLLNIAYMTLGEYPDSVPEQYRVDPSQFESDVAFPKFANVAPELGIATTNLSGGAIVDDFNGDGYLDLITSSSSFSDQIKYFENVAGKFEDRTEAANLLGIYGGLNLNHADYDNDGDLDVYVMRGAWLGEAGLMPNSLLQNDGNGRFQDVTLECGLGDAHYPSQTSAWADFNNDGFVDLYVGNEEYPSQLFQNDGKGRFRDVAASAGVDSSGFTKGVTAGDFNGDGYPDLYISNLGGDNRLYQNQRDGSFVDVAEQLDVTEPKGSFPAWFWDYNQDGILDIFVASYSDQIAYVGRKFFGQSPAMEFDRLYEGTKDGPFREVAADRKLTELTQVMGANFGDLDNDGFPDFYIGTGFPQYEGLVPNLMYWNRQGREFTDVTTPGGFGHLQKGHAISFCDFDNDGDQDVFQQMGGAYPGDRAADCLYENPGFGNNWIKIKLIGTQSNRSAIGARIRLEISDGGKPRTLYKWVNSGGSFGASPFRQEIGISRATQIDRLQIDWPTSGQSQTFENVEVNQLIEITEGETDFKARELPATSIKR